MKRILCLVLVAIMSIAGVAGAAAEESNPITIQFWNSFTGADGDLLVELVGISYEEASQIVERSPLAEPVADALGVAIFSHDLPYYWAMFFYYGNGYWQKGIPAQPEDMDAYEALENKIMEKYHLKEPFIWT